ncbi:hypothetical protein IE53DRAFT_333008 [Violaceomyces palustris]|uniref:Uncharacterized protein n=1 Tax=Violaceomyces palustris TaxID=1673888 RepID=A0ACD0NSM6_9BASI|nr:hypothetical protein IE53DRAFT_333008 [Violaceomyces palustris]
MRFSKKTLFAAGLATASSLVSAESSSDSQVLVLGTSNFTSAVEPEPLMLVEFYAPWCGHCKALAPEYDTASVELIKENIKLAKVDCTVEGDLCNQYDVKGYPTLKVFRSGSSVDYNGPRKSDGIISYMKKQALPSLSTLTPETLAEFKKKDKIVVVAYIKEGDKASTDLISKIAEANRDSYLFGVSHDEAAAKEAGVDVPSAVLYRTFDEPEVKLGKDFTEDALASFLKAETVPLIDEVGPENYMQYAESGLPLAYLFVQPDHKDKEAQVESLKSVAKVFKGKVNFVWVDAVKFANHAKALNIQGDSWPSFAIQDIENNLKYPLEDVSSDVPGKVSSFVAKYVAGDLKPSIKSEPVPKDQDGPVHVLVADAFDETAFDDSKDVLIEFYAPWCGHCKKLAPTYDTLGEKYSSHKDKVTIAKMDATANDVPPSAGFQITSFPTIKFKPAGSKDWIDFNGDRSLEGFVEFIALNGKHKVSVDIEPLNETETTEHKEAAAKPHHEEL